MINIFMQVIRIWEELSDFHLSPNVEDSWSWSWEPKGTFSTKTVYQTHFKAKILCDTAKAIWGSWTPLKCKFAMWLFIRGRVWTADRLARLPRNETCVFCNLEEENVRHLFIGYAVLNIIWSSILNWANLHQVVPTIDQSLRKWWQHAGPNLTQQNRSKLNSLLMLTTYMVCLA